MQTKAPALATLAPTTELMSALFGNANEAASFNPQGFFVTGVHTTMTEFPMNQFTMNAATAPPAVPAMTLGESPATRTDTDAIDEVFRALDDIHALWNISDR